LQIKSGQNRIKKKGKFSEELARHYFQQILNGVEYCHSMSIIIGGVTLEGVLADSEGGVKLSDFSCAVLDSDDSSSLRSGNSRTSPRPSTKTCLPQYMSPEMVKHNVNANQMSDVWSLGVTLYGMVAGRLPFTLNPTLPEMLRCICDGAYDPFPEWFSPELTSVLTSILVCDPIARATLQSVTEQPWMMWDSEIAFDAESEFGEGSVDHDTRQNTIIDALPTTESAYLCANLISNPLREVSQLLWSPIALFSSSSSQPSSSPSTATARATLRVPAAASGAAAGGSGRGRGSGSGSGGGGHASTPDELKSPEEIMKAINKHSTKDIVTYDASEISAASN
jgi:serine/threonine protein kinase